MTDGVFVDIHEIDQLAADFLKEAAEIDARATVVVTAAAQRVQDAARTAASGHPTLPDYPASITFDVTHDAGNVVAEIGPDKDLPQGPLGAILEYGSVNSAPMNWLGAASAAEENRFEAEIAAIVKAP